MDRTNHPSATPERQFTGGNPSAGVSPTVVTAPWLNNVQEEICRLIEAAGITLDPENQDQLAAAILTMIVGELATLAIADIAGLQAALDAKAATSHTHAISGVTGLQTALDGKLGISALAADSAKLGGASAAVQATADSIAKRDGSGNLTATLFNGTATGARYL